MLEEKTALLAERTSRLRPQDGCHVHLQAASASQIAHEDSLNDLHDGQLR